MLLDNFVFLQLLKSSETKVLLLLGIFEFNGTLDFDKFLK